MATVGPKLHDHNYVLVDLGFTMPEVSSTERSVWDYRNADWVRLRDALEETDWNFLRTADVHEGTQALTDTIIALSEESIGKKTMVERKTTHPWINEKVEQAIKRRNAAEGTSFENMATIECSEVMLQEREAYIEKTREEIKKLKPGSKKYWSKSNEILGQEAKVRSIPGLKNVAGEWVHIQV